MRFGKDLFQMVTPYSIQHVYVDVEVQCLWIIMQKTAESQRG